MNMKNTLPLAATTLIALSCFAHADNGRESSFKGGINSNQAIAGNASSFGISADLLYWGVKMDGMDYVLADNPTTPIAADSVNKAKYANVKTGFEAGIRLGLHMTSGKNDMFEASLIWTSHKAKKRGGKFDNTVQLNQANSVGVDDLAFLPVCAPRFVQQLSNGPAPVDATDFERIIAGGYFKPEINFFDLEIGRKFRPFNTTKLFVKPHFGLRYTQVDSSFDLTVYESGEFATANANEVLERTTRVTSESEFLGLGLRFGLETQWALSDNGLSLFANIAWSYICGEFDVKHKERVTEEAGDFAATTVMPRNGADALVRDQSKSGKSIVDTFFGVMYESTLNNGGFGMTVKAGWEHHQLFGQNQFIRLLSNDGTCKTQNNGDLMLRGFTLSAKFDF